MAIEVFAARLIAYVEHAVDERQSREVVDLVAGLIATDDEFHPDELKFLAKVFERFGVAGTGDTLVVSPMRHSVQGAKAMRDLPPDVQAEALELLIESAVADGKIVAAERNYLLAVAGAAGISDEELDQRLEARLAQPGGTD